MKELVMEQVKELVIYGCPFLLMFIYIWISNRRTDWEKMREEEIIKSLKNGTAITSHPY